MKKVLVIMMILLAVTTTAVFAKQGFTLRGGFSYDFVNVKAAESETDINAGKFWRANAFGAEFGVTYNFSDSFLVYGDSSVGFYNKFKIGDKEVTKEGYDKLFFFAQTSHAGAAYDFDFDSALDLQVGGGLAVEYAKMVLTNTEKTGTKTETYEMEYGVMAVGLGLYANVGYSLSDRVSITATVHPDFMIVSNNITSITTSTTEDKTSEVDTHTFVTVGTAFSFKFNASVGVTFKF